MIIHTVLPSMIGFGAVIHNLLFDQSNISLFVGSSQRARIQAIFAADFDIEGCSQDEMDRTYRLETKRGMI